MLCSENNPSTVHFALREWKKAESPSVYWYRKFNEFNVRGSLDKMSWDHIPDNLGSWFIVKLAHGLPEKDALIKCKELYEHNIAKVTIQISEASVVVTKRDFSVTFAEQLSVISMSMLKSSEQIPICLLNWKQTPICILDWVTNERKACLLNLALLSQFNSDFVVPNRSPKEVQNQISFGLLFDSGIEKANNEVEFASNS